MLRLGMVDFDTSHVVEFTRRWHHQGIDEDQYVEGARVVLGCPGLSHMAPERIPGFQQEMEELGVMLVDEPGALLGRVDGVLITSLDGAMHLERARPFLEAGIPCFVDKPFTSSLQEAKTLLALSRNTGTPLFSSSAMRYAPEVTRFLNPEWPMRLEGIATWGPAHLFDVMPGRNPGLLHYGIHAVELLYALMGPGCREVCCFHTPGTSVVTGHWKDGRVGTMRGLRSGQLEYGFLAFTDQGVFPVAVSFRCVYRELMKQIVTFFKTRTAPVDPAITVEIIAFLEAAWKSAANSGKSERVEVD